MIIFAENPFLGIFRRGATQKLKFLPARTERYVRAGCKL